MNFVNILGFFAGALTAVSFFPQVIKTWKSKSAKDISLAMFIVFCAGVFLWLIYGIIIKSFPVIIANFVNFILAGFIIMLKIRYKNEYEKDAKGRSL